MTSIDRAAIIMPGLTAGQFDRLIYSRKTDRKWANITYLYDNLRVFIFRIYTSCRLRKWINNDSLIGILKSYTFSIDKSDLSNKNTARILFTKLELTVADKESLAEIRSWHADEATDLAEPNETLTETPASIDPIKELKKNYIKACFKQIDVFLKAILKTNYNFKPFQKRVDILFFKLIDAERYEDAHKLFEGGHVQKNEEFFKNKRRALLWIRLCSWVVENTTNHKIIEDLIDNEEKLRFFVKLFVDTGFVAGIYNYMLLTDTKTENYPTSEIAILAQKKFNPFHMAIAIIKKEYDSKLIQEAVISCLNSKLREETKVRNIYYLIGFGAMPEDVVTLSANTSLEFLTPLLEARMKYKLWFQWEQKDNPSFRHECVDEFLDFLEDSPKCEMLREKLLKV